MPKRKSIREIPSPEIQGEDSWVKVKPMTYGEQRVFRLRMRELRGDEEALELEGCKLLAEWVVDWNWVDENDEPLPKPEGNPKVIDGLLSHEIQFLTQSLSGGQEELKN